MIDDPDFCIFTELNDKGEVKRGKLSYVSLMTHSVISAYRLTIYLWELRVLFSPFRIYLNHDGLLFSDKSVKVQ